MSSFGRGRGVVPRTVMEERIAIPLVKLKSLKMDENKMNGSSAVPPLLNKSLNLHSFGESLLSVKEEDSLFPLIVNIVTSPYCTEEVVKRMVTIVIDRCMWLPVISKKYASLLNFLTSHTTFGEKVKISTYDSLQEFYEKRVELCSTKRYGEDTLRNLVVLLGEIYYRYRIHNNRIKILSSGLVTYLKMLATSVHDKDLVELAQQMSWSGHEMATSNKAEVNELMITIRKYLTLQSSSYTDLGRSCLLLCIDLIHYKFDELPNDLVTFYKENLGERIFDSMKPPSLEVDDHIEYYNSIRKCFK